MVVAIQLAASDEAVRAPLSMRLGTHLVATKWIAGGEVRLFILLLGLREDEFGGWIMGDTVWLAVGQRWSRLMKEASGKGSKEKRVMHAREGRGGEVAGVSLTRVCWRWQHRQGRWGEVEEEYKEKVEDKEVGRGERWASINKTTQHARNESRNYVSQWWRS